MKFYEFAGGSFNGMVFDETAAETLFRKMGRGLTADLSDIREKGCLVCRKELDNEFQFEGYLGPMWGGTEIGEYVLRYETPEMYERLSR